MRPSKFRVMVQRQGVTSFVTIEGETFFAARAALAVRWQVDPLTIRLDPRAVAS